MTDKQSNLSKLFPGIVMKSEKKEEKASSKQEDAVEKDVPISTTVFNLADYVIKTNAYPPKNMYNVSSSMIISATPEVVHEIKDMLEELFYSLLDNGHIKIQGGMVFEPIIIKQ